MENFIRSSRLRKSPVTPLRRLTTNFSVTTFLLLALVAVAHAGFSKLDTEKRTSNVTFPQMDEPVRVFALNETVKLAQEQIDNLIRARDRNAFWLLCDERGDKTLISYRFRFTNRPYADREFRVTGRYDRGVYLKLPSEYALFRGKADKYQYVDDEEYFKVLVPVEPPPEISEWNLAPQMFHYGIPNFIQWAEPTYFAKPFSYWTEREMSALKMIRDYNQFQYGYEFWFEKPDMRLVREMILAPKTVENSEHWENVRYDYDQPEIVKTVEYTYGENGESEFPTDVSIWYDSNLFAKLEFQLVDGLWIMREGRFFSYGLDGEMSTFAISTTDLVVEK